MLKINASHIPNKILSLCLHGGGGRQSGGRGGGGANREIGRSSHPLMFTADH